MIVPRLDQEDRAVLAIGGTVAAIFALALLWVALILGLCVRVFLTVSGLQGG